MKLLRIVLYSIIGILGIVILFIVGLNVYFWILNSNAKSKLVNKPVLTDNGYEYRDLNNNGKLDIYEDARMSVEARINDLISQMTLEEKVGLMWHPPIGVGEKGKVLSKPAPMRFSFYSSL